MTLTQLVEYMKELAPLELAESWDNSGLLVQRQGEEVHRVLLTLDITPQVVAEAVQRDAQVIVSHHPVIFSPLKKLTLDNAAVQMVRNNLAAICMHTNLDAAELGVNTQLACRLDMTHLVPLGEGAIGLVGQLPRPMVPKELALFIKERLQAPCVEFCTQTPDKPIRMLGMCSGAGADFAPNAYAMGAEAFLTGEIKYHELLDAKLRGECILSAGHFYTEALVMPPLRCLLAQKFPDAEFIVSEMQEAPGIIV